MPDTRFGRMSSPARIRRLWSGAALRVFRNRSAWTQDGLAHLLGISDSTWSRFEQGSLPIPNELVSRIESLLGIPASGIERAGERLCEGHRGVAGTAAWRFRRARELLEPTNPTALRAG